ncbi:hypothetical protein GD429_39020 [Burkholderia sp. BE17]|nr:hypothetical protein [Burkholderia sp. BE17]
MRESIGTNDRSPIDNPRESIAGFRLQFAAHRSAIADTRAARPIVARCTLSEPDACQGRTRRAPSAGMREKRRRAGLRGPSDLDSRATRSTLEYGLGRRVCAPFRTPGFRPAATRKTR